MSEQPDTATPERPVTEEASPPPTEEQAQLLRQALRRLYVPGYFNARKGTEEDSQWMALERAGWAEEFRDGISVRMWRVTDKGRKAVQP